MTPQPVQCKSCGRVIMSEHADAAGDCGVCAGPVSATQVFESTTPEEVTQAWNDLSDPPAPKPRVK